MSIEMKDNEWIREMRDFEDLEYYLSDQNEDRHAFHLFFARFLDGFRMELDRLLSSFEQESQLKVHKESIVPDVTEAMLNELSSFSIRTLIYEINEKRILGLLQGETPEKRYEYYNNQFKKKEPFYELLNKYPVLYTLMHHMIQGRLGLIKEALHHLSRDARQIADEFSQPFTEITRIRVTSGDTHNNGKKVLGITTDTGKFIYKPHSLSTDSLYNHLVDFMNQQGTLKMRLEYVPSIDKVDYGWQKYVEPGTCTSVEEVCSYYYRLGANLSLLHMIGATDIHFENLISAGEHPYIIDLETLVENKTMEMERSGGLVEEFNRSINESVLGTAVLPLNFKNSIFDFDMSAMSNFEEQKSDFWKMFVVLNNYTDEIKLERMPGSIGKASNFVILNGEKIEPYLYIEDLLEGFEQGYRLICEHKQQFMDALFSYCDRFEVVVRQVLKPTSIYAKFLEASTHPNYLKSPTDRLTLLSKLKTKKDLANDKIMAQRDFEIAALFQCDIPYFTTTMNSKDIICNNNGVIPDYFQLTLMDIILKRVSRITLEQLEHQLYLIRLSISTSVNNNWLKEAGRSFPRLNEQIPYFKSSMDYTSGAREIGDFMDRSAVWNEERTTCTWLTQLIDGERLKLGAMNYFLYEGGGAILFLYMLAKETGEQKYHRLAEAGLRGIEEQMRGADMKPALSSFNGIGSLIYIYYTLYKMHGDAPAYAKYESYLGQLGEAEVEGDHEIDYVSGIAGLITLLLNIYEAEEDPRLLGISDRLGDYAYNRIINTPETILTGMSHGFSGMTLAMIKLGTHLKEDRYISLARHLLEQENKYYSGDKMNWLDLRDGEQQADPVYWCHGAPGIALARTQLLPYSKELDSFPLESDIHRGVSKLLQDGFSEKHDHSLCHGVFGNIDILLTAGTVINEQGWLDQAHAEARQALQRIRDTRVICGLNNAFDLMSFMVGLTGIGYALLRLNNPDLPSVLAMEIYH
ncbi:type 2 lantipeptide synthetase LanM [Paenibacillus zeisoli]|uniref:Type 2 lantipeptide synthetase LanM n=1 Tax=Paenibacillus zeisoli TaxID=2496267 RepID=A0A433XCF3_9BACL|nr:type 2 lanthipeptide synthetase LanM family protein [Paenibacillus zeisoli]RUT31746.1 type 2 lantipeptide synthetase LanM [Paenibacillus zeisoli]